jgi:hypothetical protein
MNSKTEKQMAVRCSQFQTSHTLKDWVELFQQVLAHQGG